ncbi:MAG: TIM barrel protein [Gemmatimonadetes bacterium]|nr:TIM barrel protein [Gemmatimonadota bacterium]
MTVSRRDAITRGAAALAAAGLPATLHATSATMPERAPDATDPLPPFAPTYRQSVARWCFSNLPLDQLCLDARRVGVQGIDLLSENEWDVPARHGLRCAIANGPGPIPDGWNDPKRHDTLVAESERLLPLIAKAGIPQMIVFSGNRRGQSDGEGIRNCVRGLRRILTTAEHLGVTIVMELLNSKVDHADYQADRTTFGVALAEALGSERFRLLYDIYHMQIMEGDVVRTIERYAPYIGHYHTAGVPGRHELDETQELNYGRIARAIAGTGFQGYVAHEFIPTGIPMRHLAEAVRLFAG